MTLPETPSQTIGPFFAVGLCWPDGPAVVADGTPGAVWVGGQVIDGAGDPVPDALVETWQADGQGRFAQPDDPSGSTRSGFRGSGAARPTLRAVGRSGRSGRARSRRPAVVWRPPTSTSRCLPGVCSTGW